MAIPYFSYIPKTVYNLSDGIQNNKTITNILTRSAFLREIIGNSSLYYEYQVKDEDTPEIIADKLYGTVNRNWIVLFFNQIIDPYYTFPKNRKVLEDYIVDKYNHTSINQAYSTLHSYEIETVQAIMYNGLEQSKTSTFTVVNQNDVDYSTGTYSTRVSLPGIDQTIQLDTRTASFSSSIQVITTEYIRAYSNYSYEDRENEKRRTIKLLDKRYVNRVEDEMKRLMGV